MTKTIILQNLGALLIGFALLAFAIYITSISVEQINEQIAVISE